MSLDALCLRDECVAYWPELPPVTRVYYCYGIYFGYSLLDVC